MPALERLHEESCFYIRADSPTPADLMGPDRLSAEIADKCRTGLIIRPALNLGVAARGLLLGGGQFGGG